MKKVLSYLLCLVVLLGIVGCGSNEEKDTEKNINDVTEIEDEKTNDNASDVKEDVSDTSNSQSKTNEIVAENKTTNVNSTQSKNTTKASQNTTSKQVAENQKKETTSKQTTTKQTTSTNNTSNTAKTITKSGSIQLGRYYQLLSKSKTVTYSTNNSNVRLLTDNGYKVAKGEKTGTSVVTGKLSDGTIYKWTITVKNCTDHSAKSKIGKYFDTKEEAEACYLKEINYWSNLEENDEITWDEYLEKCPSGWYADSCVYCGKWALNYYYR